MDTGPWPLSAGRFFNVYRSSRMQAVVRGNVLRRPSAMQFSPLQRDLNPCAGEGE